MQMYRRAQKGRKQAMGQCYLNYAVSKRSQSPASSCLPKFIPTSEVNSIQTDLKAGL